MKRSGYPSVELFRLQVAPDILRELKKMRRTICNARFPLNSAEMKASYTFLGQIDAFSHALTGFPSLLLDRPHGGPPKPTSFVDIGSEEWWRRQVEGSKEDDRPWG